MMLKHSAWLKFDPMLTTLGFSSSGCHASSIHAVTSVDFRDSDPVYGRPESDYLPKTGGNAKDHIEGALV
jgi:hypothetical protein